MIDGVGIFGTNTNLLAGSTQSNVWNTFTDPTGSAGTLSRSMELLLHVMSPVGDG